MPLEQAVKPSSKPVSRNDLQDESSHTGSIVPLQMTSMEVWQQKYCLKNSQGIAVDSGIEASLERVARALADVEVEAEKKEQWYPEFLWALKNGAIPAGRILSNAGAGEYKSDTSTINCTVSGSVRDSMSDILEKNLQAGLTLKSGCGIGYEFSTLRPKGAYVSGAGAKTSGPLSFMDIFDKTCFTVSSAGGRRGAQMATFDISHPDVYDFIKAKAQDGCLRQFNLSLLISDEFIEAVLQDKEWALVFPFKEGGEEAQALDLKDPKQVIWRSWASNDGYVVNKKGLTACKVYRWVSARDLWQCIMESTYNFAEPGFILIDRVNEMNNNWFCESIRATNPCGEQPLPAYGSCLLGSVNLTQFVENPFTAEARFNWDKYRRVVSVFTRMLDNVVEINGLPLEQQKRELFSKRRHGMGFLGLGSTMAMLQMRYGDDKSITFTDKVSKELALAGWRVGVELAKEKGSAPILEEKFKVTQSMLRQRPEMLEQGYKAGDQVLGKVLHAKFSRYMQRVAEQDAELVKQIEKHGCRFTHHSSIAPTGTISLTLGNNASNGIEPSFAHLYSRNVIKEGRKTKEKVDVLSYELLAYRHWIDADAGPGEGLPDYFVTTDEITPEQHLDVQAAAQRWVDSSISKTINVPTDIAYDDFKDIYLYAHRRGLKGCTTFRFNPDVFSGVLVREEDLANTLYRFTLADGSIMEAKGNDEILYEGETHTAANLFEALKEGYYGKL
ncbi:MAG: adenosylcobalamin-dependent ribonucleoside-diphosphate reductase [Pseudomonadales bacterium]|nr:adenosylcobalamin-dependent ribonucleoside-diphosphate reductase [Pseudomonadales bacterium]